MSSRKKIFNILKYVLAVLLAAGLVYMALKEMDWQVFIDALGTTRWEYVALSMGFALAALYFRNERWNLLLKPINPEIRRMTLWDASNIGNLTSVVLPWMSFLVRCGAVTDKKTPYDKTVGTILMERAWDCLCVFLLIVCAVILNTGDIAAWLVENIAVKLAHRINTTIVLTLVGLIVLAIVGVWVVYKLRSRNSVAAKLAEWIDGIMVGFKSFKDVKHKLPFVLHTLAIWVSYVMMCWSVFKAVPVLSHLGFSDALFISVVGNLSAMLPVPGGFGSFHYFVAMALSSIYGVDWEIGILFATLTHETRSLMLVALGAISLISSQKKIKI